MASDQMSELLDLLVKKSGCHYISDLHSSYFFGGILCALKEISPDDYPLWIWTDAARYISRSNYTGSTVEDAYAFLANWLSKNQ